MPLCTPGVLSPARGDLGLKLVLELLGYFILGRTASFFLFCVCYVGQVAPGASHLLGTQGRQLALLTGVFPSSSCWRTGLLSCPDAAALAEVLGGGGVLSSVDWNTWPSGAHLLPALKNPLKPSLDCVWPLAI